MITSLRVKGIYSSIYLSSRATNSGRFGKDYIFAMARCWLALTEIILLYTRRHRPTDRTVSVRSTAAGKLSAVALKLQQVRI